MRKKLFITLCSFLLVTLPCWGESVEESLRSCGERVRQLNSQPETQAQALVLQDLNKVQANLGHTDIKTTQIYAKVAAMLDKSVVEQTSSLMGF